MKKAALGFIALAMSLMANTAQAYNGTGDIRAIDPCDQYGYVIENGSIANPYTVGQTAYFRIRLENVNSKQSWITQTSTMLSNPWSFELNRDMYPIADEITINSLMAQNPPKVGVWVSGSLRYADVHWMGVPDGKGWYTDIVCAYTVQPGDLAFPMAMASSEGKKIGDGSSKAYKLLNVGGALDPWKLVANERESESSWGTVTATNVVCSFWWSEVGTGNNCLDKTSDTASERQTWLNADWTLEQAGLFIKTIDFATSEYTVAEGRTDKVTVGIEGGVNTNGNGVVYAKIKDGEAVSLAESSVEVINMWDGSATNAYQVAKVTIPSGEDAASFSFKVKGERQSDVPVAVYLSSTKEFDYDDNYAIMTNFVMATVKCTAPPPPYIAVTLDGEASKSITSSSNFRDYASKLTVTISEAYDSDVTVEVAPSMLSGSGTDPLGKYIAMSSYAENGYTEAAKSVTFTVADMTAGILSKDIYVYVLGADDDTDGIGKGIKFEPKATGAAANYFNNENISAILYLKKCTPEILYPAESDSFSGLAGGVTSTFTIKVSDDYSNMQQPFNVEWLKTGSGSPSKFTVTPNSDGEATVSVRYNAGEYTTRFRVQNASGVWSDYRTIAVQVNPAKQVTAVVVDPADTDEFDETLGEISVRFNLTEAYEDSTLYAFLVPQDAVSSNLVYTKAFTTGVAIKSGDTESSSTAKIELLDGTDETQPLVYSIVLTTSRTWGQGEIIGTYESKDLELFVNNVAPKVLAVNMTGSAPVTVSEGTFGGKASMGLNKIFTLDVDDIDADLTNAVTSVWTFSDPNGNAKEVTLTAPVDDIVLTNVFEIAGTYSCMVKLQDKDMSKRQFGEIFKFNVVVLDTPSVEITFPNSSTFNETEADKGTSYFNVGLSTPASKPVVVSVECTRTGIDGVLNVVTNELTFPAGRLVQQVLIDELDGTADSVSFKGGFSVTAKVVTETTNEDGIAFKDVYLPATVKMYVANEAPTIVFPIDTGATNDASINVDYPLAWKIADVDADLTNGLSVVWTTSEGVRWVAPGENVVEGVFTNRFKSGGAKTVTMTVTDKDGGVSLVTMYYKVAASKQVYVYPMGPYYGGLTPLSRMYASASGIGEGRAWADGTRDTKNFVHTYTYGATIVGADIAARGYVNGQEDREISESGNTYAEGDTAYRYSDPLARDSFFYAWLVASKEDEATTYTGTALISPVSPKSKNGAVQYRLSLPIELAGDESNPMYPDRLIEAFFSKELYPSDNMGDMNADGVPDYFATLYWSLPTGEYATVPEAMTGQAIAGSGGEEGGDSESATASDLASISTYNGDLDFLPAAWNSVNPLKPANRNWGPGLPFTAVKEIRGLDNGLNEAGVSDYELTEAEKHALFAAAALAGSPAADYAAATNWATRTGWTPEAVDTRSGARLNPLNPDTDGDGFDDGWEYYFWYYSKIGAMVDGVWSRLEGRRFDPTSPSLFVRIAPEEIAAAFDPHVARFGGDFDNDGLSDLEEFVLGTNPCDFDSNETNVSDLWYVMMGLDSKSAVYDENPDCDFMARCDYDGDTFTLYTFADGKVFALPTATASAIAPAEPSSTSSYYKVELADAAYWVAAVPVTYKMDDVEYLATNEEAYAVLEMGGAAYLGEKAVLAAGTRVSSVASDAVPVLDSVLPEAGFEWTSPETLERANTTKALEVFNYGGDGVTYVPCTSNVTTYADVPVGVAVVKVQPEMKVTLLHNQVMVQYGFDPRVAWNIDTYGLLDNRWRKPDSEDAGSLGLAGVPTNTVAYTSRDEFLVMQYRMNAQRDAYPQLDMTPSVGSFLLYTTYPNLPVEFIREKDFAYKPFTDTNETYSAYWDSLSKDVTIHGADTDDDGVPDGWELYVNANPNNELDGASYKDGDKLCLAQEYAGVDSCNAYTNRFDKSGNVVYPEVESITKNHPGKTEAWWNKFFPTNPDSDDTDGDGISDSDERDSHSGSFPVGRNTYSGAKFTFIYGENGEKYAADGNTTCFRGGGLNPCTVDTDGDLLPDAWEWEFAGIVFNGTTSSVALESDDLLKLIQADAHQSGVDTNATASIRGGMDGTFADANYDFDQDGLLNFQEYLVQSLRHLRYDDALTPLMGMDPGTRQFVRFLPFSAWDGNAFHKKCNASGFTGLGAWQFSDLGYFALPPHSWDSLALNSAGLAACSNYKHSEGAGYRIMLRPSVDIPLLGRLQAGGYASTDPRRWDTDNDGMDDYYEIFHGLNPLLGSAVDPTAKNEQGLYNFQSYDVIGSIYGGTVNAWCNHWTGYALGEQPAFDAIKYPWMIGTMECDADGDGLRNDEESLKVNVANPKNTHTDPTPLWMTDSTSTRFASFTSQYYRPDPYLSETPEYMELNSHHDLFCYPWKDLRWNTVVYAPGSGGINRDWMFSFEENEGYDTDHDFKRDATELVKGVEPTSDPLNFMDPNRRQALYLPGDQSAAVSYDSESRRSIGTEPDLLKQFTVECWVRPDGEAKKDVVIVERVCVYGASTLSNNQSYVRANFRIGVDADGNVYGKYEGSAVDSGEIKVTGLKLDANKWTHIAFTYNGYTAALYMNGDVAPVASINGAGLIPANGIDGILQESGTSVMPYTGYRALPCANIIGARALTPNAVSVNPETTWADFSGFFKGWIDEVRVWDGPRTPSDIHASYLKRYSFDDVAELRETVYKAWRNGATRAGSDSKTALPAELLLHYNFAALPGGVEPKNVMTAPTGFLSAVLDNVRKPNGRDLDMSLDVGWWSQLAGINSKVYSNYAIVPWIPNTVAHLPLMDGSSIDSQYWNSYASGLMGAAYVGLDGYAYPNSANPYSSYVYRFEKLHHLNRLAAASTLQVADSDGYPVYDRYLFQLRSDFVGTTDLLPLGGAFAKRGTDFWDGQGAMDAWTTTSANYEIADADGNGIPDWAEALGYTTAEAYRRALAEGLLPSSGTAVLNGAFADVADSNNDGLYDWWQQMHDLKGSAKGDTDKDGLADFAEYLVSDVFKFCEISPVITKTDGNEFDYFRKAGMLYLGELFTDHDFMEDDWENLFANSIVDAAQYDPSADPDGDGWSNYAECRAGTLPDRTASIVIGADELADYPIPTIRVKANYAKASEMDAPIVVRAFSSGRSAMDAEWTVPGSSVPVACERAIGLNPGKKMTFDLGPGVIVPGETKVMMRDTSEVSSDGVWANPSDSVWREVLVETVIPGDQDMGNLSKIREPVGTVSYPTSKVEIDFTALQGYVYYNDETGLYSFSPMGTNAYMRLDMQNSYVKIVWQSMRVPGESSWNFSLSKPAVGHVREGLNTFVAFVDLNGDGVWDESEPMGVVRNVNVGWNSADVEIEITDGGVASAQRVNLNVEGESDSASRNVTVTVERNSINGKTSNSYGSIVNPLVATFDIGNRSYLHEGDFMKELDFDIDWSAFKTDVLDSGMVKNSKLNVTSVVYRVTLDSNVALASNTFDVVRTFTAEQFKPVPVNANVVNYGARPLFAWTLDGVGADTFTAFSVQVKDDTGAVVWNSGHQMMPPKSPSGVYEWRAPLHVGDLASAGKVFENFKNYTWQVSVHNSKYQDALWSDAQTFRMNVYDASEANSGNYGVINACVKYFGPGQYTVAPSRMADVIRVEAYTTPDFSGVPAGRTYVQSGRYASVTNDSHAANATIIGLEAGTYYLRAFIDSDGDGKRSDWESWGYVCPRGDIASGGIFNPVAITVGSGTAPVEVCYIEDTDVDQDCLPDVYEYNSAGTDKTDFLEKKGVAENDHNGYIAVNPNLQTAIDNLIGAGNTVGMLSLGGGQVSMQVAALSLGVSTLENSIEESTLAIKSISLENGNVNLTVGAEANEPSLGTVFVSDGKVTTTIVIRYADSLDGEWNSKEVTKTFEIEDGSVGETFTISLEELGLDSTKGFFKVELK